MEKIVRIGEAKTHGDREYSVYCKIQIGRGNLSISGVEGPLSSGKCRGSCGQINMLEWNIIKYAPRWSAELEKRFRETWKRWHLNDMRAECEHQRARGEKWTTHPSAVCPECGYKLGHAWLKEELPQEVIDFLGALPDSDNVPAWI